MSTCWKCGKPAPPGTAECEACELGPMADPTQEAKFHELDLAKVVTPEDVRTLLAAFPWKMAVSEDHPHFAQLKRFLKS